MNSFNNNLKSGFGQRDCHGVQLPDDQITQLPNLRVLYVAYPLLTVSDESAGGAEQMLWILEREMVRRGVSATVAASAGSRVSGELFPTGDACTQPDDYE